MTQPSAWIDRMSRRKRQSRCSFGLFFHRFYARAARRQLCLYFVLCFWGFVFSSILSKAWRRWILKSLTGSGRLRLAQAGSSLLARQWILEGLARAWRPRLNNFQSCYSYSTHWKCFIKDFCPRVNELEGKSNKNNCLVSNIYNTLKISAVFSLRNRLEKSARYFNML